MNNLNNEKADVVSVILENNELLDAFADTLIVEEAEEDLLSTLSANSFGRAQKLKFYLWKKIKELMVMLSNKIQVLAIIAEYNFRNEEKKIQLTTLKKD